MKRTQEKWLIYSIRTINFSYLTKIVILVMAFIGAIASPVYAEIPNYGYLYRADTRGPDVIFKDGFTAWGDNRNLVQHSTGFSFAPNSFTPNSVFISTTADVDFAIRLALDISSEHESTPVHVYTIRSTADFYQSSLSLPHTPSFLNIHILLPSALGFAQHESEWVTSEHISPELIIGSRTYTAPPNRRYLGVFRESALPAIPRIQLNHSFREIDPVINPAVHPFMVLAQEGASNNLAATTYCAPASSRSHRQVIPRPSRTAPPSASEKMCAIVRRINYFKVYLCEN
jgi:hypothetical protein